MRNFNLDELKYILLETSLFISVMEANFEMPSVHRNKLQKCWRKIYFSKNSSVFINLQYKKNDKIYQTHIS